MGIPMEALTFLLQSSRLDARTTSRVDEPIGVAVSSRTEPYVTVTCVWMLYFSDTILTHVQTALSAIQTDPHRQSTDRWRLDVA